jgi:hypothetical protein
MIFVLIEDSSMKNWLIALLIPTLMACSVKTKNNDFYGSNYVDKQEIDSFALPRHAINDVVKGLAYQMLESSNCHCVICGFKKFRINQLAW